MDMCNVYPHVTVASSDPMTLSPLILTREGKLVLQNFYEVLFELNGFNGTPYGRIGKSWHWDVDEDGNDKMCIEIYDYIYDTAGNHYTAHDTYFCYMTDWEAGYLQNFGVYIKELKVVDDYHIDFILNKGQKDTLLIEYSVLGKCLQYTRAAYEASKDGMASNPVGTGPYVLVEYKPGESITVERAKSYWQKEELLMPLQRSNVQTITYKFITNSDERAKALLNHDVAYVDNIAYRHVKQFQKLDEFSVCGWLKDTVHYFVPNCAKGRPCSDINLRAAIFYACDSKDFVEACGGAEKAIRTYCFGTISIGNYNPDWEKMQNYYTICDLELAGNYLKQSDYQGQVLKLLYESGETGEYYLACAKVVGRALEQLGIRYELIEKDVMSLRDIWDHDVNGWDLIFSSWASQDNMANFYDKLYDANRFDKDLGLSNIKDDQLYEMFWKLYCRTGNTQENINQMHKYETEHFYSYGLFQPVCYDVYQNSVIDRVVKNERNWFMPGAFSYHME